jgi:hypothetical protein
VRRRWRPLGRAVRRHDHEHPSAHRGEYSGAGHREQRLLVVGRQLRQREQQRLGLEQRLDVVERRRKQQLRIRILERRKHEQQRIEFEQQQLGIG